MEGPSAKQGARGAVAALAALLLVAGAAPGANAAWTATSVGSDHTGRFAFVSPDRTVSVVAADGRELGTEAIPAIPEEESGSRPPRVLGVVDGGAVIGITRADSVPISDPLGYYAPGEPFKWLCGVSGVQRCPTKRGFGTGDLLAIGRYWGWYQQDAAEDGLTAFPMRMLIRDGKLTWREPTRQEQRRVPDHYFRVPGPVPFQFSESIPPFSLDGSELRRQQPWGYAAQAGKDTPLVVRLRGDKRPESSRISDYQNQPDRGGPFYNPHVGYGSSGVVWTTGTVVGFWDRRSRTVWRRPLRRNAIMADTAGNRLLLGFGDQTGTREERVARLRMLRLPENGTPKGWSVLRQRLRPGSQVRFR